MLTTLALTTMLFAPAAPANAPAAVVPAPRVAITPSVTPRIVELKPDADGKVRVAVLRPQKGVVVINPAPRGGPVPPMIGRGPTRIELAEVKDLKVITAGGKKIKREEALKRLAKGGLVVVSADGKPIAPAILKMFKEDVLVLMSPELVMGYGGVFRIQGGPGVVPANPGANPAQVPPPAPKK